MPRKPRFYLPDVPVHVVQRGHSRKSVFFEDNDYLTYIHWLGEGIERYQVGVHAYALMTNHIHILATPHDKDSITRIMQYLGRHYVPYINHPYGTSGSIWEGRYKASLIHDEEYLQTCVRYIELNPGRVDMVRTPSQYRWSSYRCNGQGKEDNLITHHQLYKALGRSQEDRLEAYKGLYKDHLENGVNRNIRSSLQTGTPLGDDYFRQKIEDKLQCKVGHARRGRPMKPKDGDFLE